MKEGEGKARVKAREIVARVKTEELRSGGLAWRVDEVLLC